MIRDAAIRALLVIAFVYLAIVSFVLFVVSSPLIALAYIDEGMRRG